MMVVVRMFRNLNFTSFLSTASDIGQQVSLVSKTGEDIGLPVVLIGALSPLLVDIMTPISCHSQLHDHVNYQILLPQVDLNVLRLLKQLLTGVMVKSTLMQCGRLLEALKMLGVETERIILGKLAGSEGDSVVRQDSDHVGSVIDIAADEIIILKNDDFLQEINQDVSEHIPNMHHIVFDEMDGGVPPITTRACKVSSLDSFVDVGDDDNRKVDDIKENNTASEKIPKISQIFYHFQNTMNGVFELDPDVDLTSKLAGVSTPFSKQNPYIHKTSGEIVGARDIFMKCINCSKEFKSIKIFDAHKLWCCEEGDNLFTAKRRKMDKTPKVYEKDDSSCEPVAKSKFIVNSKIPRRKVKPGRTPGQMYTDCNYCFKTYNIKSIAGHERKCSIRSSDFQ